MLITPGLDLRLKTVRPAGSASSLLTDLVSWWKLDEESGTRADAVGAHDLTDVNTVLYDTGVIGNSAKFDNTNGEYLEKSGISPAIDIRGMSFWVKPLATDATYEFYLGAIDAWASDISLQVYKYNTQIVANATADGLVQATTTALVAGNWHHITAWWEDSEKKVYICVNNGTPVASSATTGTHDTAAKIILSGAAAGSFHASANIDLAGIWSRVLTADERTELYNLGAGKDYPF